MPQVLHRIDSGEYGGNWIRLTLLGTTTSSPVWKPAPSQISTACTPAGNWRENCSKNRLTTSVFSVGMITADIAPVAAQTAAST